MEEVLEIDSLKASRVWTPPGSPWASQMYPDEKTIEPGGFALWTLHVLLQSLWISGNLLLELGLSLFLLRAPWWHLGPKPSVPSQLFSQWDGKGSHYADASLLQESDFMVTEQSMYPTKKAGWPSQGRYCRGKKALGGSGEWIFRVCPWPQCKLLVLCHSQHLFLLNGLMWQHLA